jgi:hypothetical protein
MFSKKLIGVEDSSTAPHKLQEKLACPKTQLHNQQMIKFVSPTGNAK